MVADRWLILAEQEKADKVYDDILAGDDYGEDLWDEIRAILDDHGDAYEDMTMKDIVRKTADKIARRWSETDWCLQRAEDMAREA